MTPIASRSDRCCHGGATTAGRFRRESPVTAGALSLAEKPGTIRVGGGEVKFGIRKPSLAKRVAARTSVARYVRHSLGFKAPRGLGWLTNPKKAAYNRIYNRTTVKADNLIAAVVVFLFTAIGSVIGGVFSLFSGRSELPSAGPDTPEACPRCGSGMVLRNGTRGQFYGCSRFPRCRGTRDYVP
jgi:hypothetical protein